MSLSANTTPENLLPTRCSPSRDCGLTKIKASRRIADRNTDHKPVNRIPGAIREIDPFVDEHLRIGMMFQPGLSGNQLVRQQGQPGPGQLAVDGRTPRLGPHTLALPVPSGHRVHEQLAFVSERVGRPCDSPVMDETGVANGSPCDEYRGAADLVIDHLAYPASCPQDRLGRLR